MSARALRVALAGEAALDLGRVSGKLTKTGDMVTLEQLSIASLGGAAVTAAGISSAKGSHLEVRLEAAQLNDLAALARRFAPGRWSEALEARARALANAKLTIKADAAPAPPGQAPALAALSVDGVVGATKVVVAARPDGPGNLALSLALDAPEAAPLLRQLGQMPAGGAALQGATLGPARVNLAGRLRGDQFDDISADANLAGVALIYRGGAAQGKASLKSANLAPLLQAFGLAVTDAGKAAPALAAEAAARPAAGARRLVD